jgi:hypothetical protein
MIRAATLTFRVSLAILLCAQLCPAQQLGTPGPEHAILQKMEGTWDAVMSLRSGPKTRGQMICKMECGGLWRQRDLKCDLGSLKLHTKGLDSYDPLKKKYVSVAVDSTLTIPVVMEGTYDEATKTLTLSGESRNFNGTPEQLKTVTKYVDDDHVTFEMYRVFSAEKESRMITIDYTRQKQEQREPAKDDRKGDPKKVPTEAK